MSDMMESILGTLAFAVCMVCCWLLIIMYGGN